MSEKDVTGEIRTAAVFHGYQVDDMTQPRRTKMPLGLPDLRVRHPKRRLRLWIEVKTERGKLSPAQMAWHEMETACGGMVATLRSGAEAHEFFSSLHAAQDRGELVA